MSSGDTRHGCRNGANGSFNQQGTKAYIKSIIANLRANADKLSVDQEKLLKELEGADEVGKIKSFVLRQKFTSSGDLGATQLIEVTN
ncbi:MAG: hypothetical protein MUF58_13360 [Arcicella sp.]|nr:hypothetical protein [Arcicella sp.]